MVSEDLDLLGPAQMSICSGGQAVEVEEVEYKDGYEEVFRSAARLALLSAFNSKVRPTRSRRYEQAYVRLRRRGWTYE